MINTLKKQRVSSFILMLFTTVSLFSMEQRKQELIEQALAQARKDGSMQTVQILSQLQALMQITKPQKQEWTQPASEK